MELKNKRVLVAGMGVSGVASAVMLDRVGARLILHDAERLEHLSVTTQQIVRTLEYEDFLGRSAVLALDHTDLVVASPGLPLDLPLLLEARTRHIPVISEIELGYQWTAGDVVAITGTNGKTTTTALTGEIFRESGRKTYVLGNIGTPLTECALSICPKDVVVVETAALQLDNVTTYRPAASAILNITPDHLDRYGTMDRYIAAKTRVYENQTAADWCVLNRDDTCVRALADSVRARVMWFSLSPFDADGVYVQDGNIVVSIDGLRTRLLSANEVAIPGDHNLQNALAATALAVSQGVEHEAIVRALRAFPGVEHRIEPVCMKRGIHFVNDSKGTNPDATIRAVRAMTRPIILILGGYDKHADFEPLMAELVGRVKHIVAIGQTGPSILTAAHRHGIDSAEYFDNFEGAINAAVRAAAPNDVVLLSPACASWDMFENFEERGRRFKEIVRSMS